MPVGRNKVSPMRYGIYISNYALDGNPRKFQQLAIAAEKAGWQGFYIWDHVYPKARCKIADPWITLAGIAASTESMRIGTTVTPLPRRRPQKIAREVVSLDQLSNGRFTLGVGLGSPPELELFGEDGNLKTRAEKLDESLEILEGLWTGKPFSYNGTHYKIGEVCFTPRPVQKPRVPIWCAGFWPIKKPFRRAAKYEGIFPLRQKGSLKPKDFFNISEYIHQYRSSKKPFDIVTWGRSKGESNADTWIHNYEDAGVTWFLEIIMGRDFRKILSRIQLGPPKV
jgi:alkanesulfonate monooxygenase SsuD/methylene tetrahydromethanopterin reductase-like flavin-dependent oxidoreductase (luciferase family)